MNTHSNLAYFYHPLHAAIPGAEDYNDSTRRGTSTIVVDPGLLVSSPNLALMCQILTFSF